MIIVDYEWSATGNSGAIQDWSERFLNHLDDTLYDAKDCRYVNISIKHNSKDRMVGYCHGDEEEVWIELDETLIGDEDYFKETLAHELIHAKQLLKGELKDIGGFKTLWKGEEYVNLRGFLKEEHYKNLPWEVEAYSRQSEHTQVNNEAFFDGTDV
jgi:hypothetical protein